MGRIRTPEYRAKQKAKREARTPEERLRDSELKAAWKRANRERVREANRAWEKANPEKMKEKQLKRDFGIGLFEYGEMLQSQDGKCAICKTSSPGGRSKGYFHVDHDHASGRIRGLLCFNCNAGLGYFKDVPDRLEGAAQYLRNAHG